jgi:DNA-binding NarL/FixJ family response regulator
MKGVSLQGNLMVTVLLVDDQSIVRQGLRMELARESDMTVVGEADSGEKALALAAHLQPDVVLMDVKLPLMDGITTTAKLRAVAPTCAVVILSLCDDAKMRTRAQAAGAVAFVGKQEPGETLLTAIRRAAARSTEPE